MAVAVRSYVATGLALMGAGVVTAGQVAPPLQKSEQRIVEAAVNLVAAVGNGQACSGYNTDGCDIWATPTYTPVAADPSGSVANIPMNLVNAVLGVPRAWLDGLNELSYALEVTGNWWVYSPTNVLGTDPADPAKYTALIDQLIPFKPLSHAIGDQFSWWARANLPMNAGCTGSVGPACADPLGILGVMFQAPVWTLSSGYKFPTLDNPISNAEGDLGDVIPGSVGAPVPWSGSSVKLDPMDPINSVLNFLMADPSTNTPAPITLADIGSTLSRFAKALEIAFNPFVPRSFLLKGWPYTALTPLFLPFVPLFCKTCDPDNPGGPPLGSTPSAAAAAPEAELVSTSVTEPAPVVDTSVSTAAPADGTGEPAVTGGDKRTEPSTSGDSVIKTASDPTDAASDATDVSVASPVDTSTPASRASAARAGFPDLAPVDVVPPSDTAAAPSQSDSIDAPSHAVGKPHRGPSHATTSEAKNDSGSVSAASSTRSGAANTGE